MSLDNKWQMSKSGAVEIEIVVSKRANHNPFQGVHFWNYSAFFSFLLSLALPGRTASEYHGEHELFSIC